MLRLLRSVDRAFCRILNGLTFRLKRVECHADLAGINGAVRVVGQGRIVIGAGTRMNSGPRRNPIGGDTCLTLVCRGGKIDIGPDCGLSNCTIVSDTHVIIGAGTMIGGGVKIYDTNFHSIDSQLRRQERVRRYHGLSRPVTIGRDVFIGAHAIILKGVTIGDRSVVGAGSVVSRDIPADEIWAGNPARLVRSLGQMASAELKPS